MITSLLEGLRSVDLIKLNSRRKAQDQKDTRHTHRVVETRMSNCILDVKEVEGLKLSRQQSRTPAT